MKCRLLVYFFLSVSPLYGQSPVQILSECESLSGWGSSANLVRDAKQGQFAIAADLPADRTGFLTFNYFQTGIDISNSYALSFWWKAEGLADFKIKVRNYPLVGGMEAVYTIWSGTAPPDGWQQTTVVLSKPQFDSWGGEPDQTRRYVTFRTVPSPNTDVRLVLDQIVVVSETFEWQVGLPAQTVVAPTVDFDGDGKIAFSDFLLFVSAYGTSKGDDSYQDRFDLDADQQIRFSDFIIFAQGFGSDGKQWHVPITVQNLTADSLSIGLGSGNHPLSALLVPGNSQSVLEIPLSIGLTAPQDPTEAYPIPLWAEVLDFSETRQHWTAYLPQTGLSQTWRQFVDAQTGQTEPVLPDFSYAGYHYFTKPIPNVQADTFNVTTFGAIPNDGKSDQLHIQRAIDSASRNGGGIVFFPPGTFLVNTDSDPGRPIYIRGSRVILRGSGSREGGTVIKMVKFLPPANPNQLWTSPYMFNFEPLNPSDGRLAKITENARRETFWITVDNTSNLSVGQWITLYMNNISAVEDFLHPFQAESIWTNIFTNGIQVREKHTIAEIQGNRIRLGEPLHANINALYSWSVRGYQHLEEVGVEDISFHGNWLEFFVHHKDAIHDGGWSLLRLNRCVNSWVRRCSFIHTNRALHLGSSSAVSVYHITQAGNKGHSSIASNGGYGVWIGLSEDLSGHHHGPGTSSRSVGTVYWRYTMQTNQRIDAHGAQPYANLLDRVDGGILYGSGASIENFPNHLQHYVLWNFKHRGNLSQYDFWRPGNARDRFVQPIIVGFHGDMASFNEASLLVNESQGSPVDPESLFEAQLEGRHGTLPFWLKPLQEEWEILRKTTLPVFPIPPHNRSN